jgi:sugar transferase (PEP-CTERM/EpsH1 system associated)
MHLAPAGDGHKLLRGGLALLAGRSVTEGYFHSRKLVRALREEASREPFDLAVGYCSSVLRMLREVPAGARVLDLVDVDSAKWQTYAERSRGLRRWFYHREAAGVRRLEREARECCDAVMLVSEAERAALDGATDNVLAVGNGVDLDHFRPQERPATDARRIVFVGQMDYRPNVEGVCAFVEDAWPALRKAMPDLAFDIVGRNPTSAVRALGEVDGVNVTGAVPDVRPHIVAASAVVVPLTVARGVQNKVLEAMAMGRAVVASTASLEGLDVEAGTHVLRADAPAEWVDSVTRLLSDDALRGRLESAARSCVEEGYTWDARLAPFVSLCEELASREDGERA